MTVVRLVLPVRSPSPFSVPCTWPAPAATAAIELATAQPVSSWQWMPMIASLPTCDLTSATMRPISSGSVPPFVSQSTRWDAPLTTDGFDGPQRELGVRLVAVEEVFEIDEHHPALPV